MLRYTQGDEVKKGQPLGFIEQLGTYVPVEVASLSLKGRSLAVVE